MRSWVGLPAFLAVLGLAAGTVSAQQFDQHTLYERNCAGCHEPHAGEFVRERIDFVDGALVGRKSGQPVLTLLETGHGRLSPEEIGTMIAHLTSIQSSGFLFHDKCAICHVRAVDLARQDLILRDGGLYGRYTGRDISEFLTGHGRLSAAEVQQMLGVLKRQLTMGQTGP